MCVFLKHKDTDIREIKSWQSVPTRHGSLMLVPFSRQLFNSEGQESYKRHTDVAKKASFSNQMTKQYHYYQSAVHCGISSLISQCCM